MFYVRVGFTLCYIELTQIKAMFEEAGVDFYFSGEEEIEEVRHIKHFLLQAFVLKHRDIVWYGSRLIKHGCLTFTVLLKCTATTNYRLF